MPTAKPKALVTTELVRPMHQPRADRIDFIFDNPARGRNVFRHGEVFKVTHPSDIEIAELMMRRRGCKTDS